MRDKTFYASMKGTDILTEKRIDVLWEKVQVEK